MERSAWMKEAIALARNGMNNGDGGPFGCIVVKNGEIVGRGWNRVLATNDPTAHAEVVAIRDACKNLNSFQLDECELYTSCEPCPMCLGAIYWSRPAKVYFAANRNDAADAGFDDSFIYDKIPLEIKDRSIPMTEMTRDEALAVFEEWKSKQNKKLY